MKCKLNDDFYVMFDELTDDIFTEFECWDKDKVYEIVRKIKDEIEFGSGMGYIIYNPSNHCSTTLDSSYIELIDKTTNTTEKSNVIYLEVE